MHYRTRQYDTGLGRFLQRDSVNLGAGPNLYSYVLSAPLVLKDPLGMEPEDTVPYTPGIPGEEEVSEVWGAAMRSDGTPYPELTDDVALSLEGTTSWEEYTIKTYGPLQQDIHKVQCPAGTQSGREACRSRQCYTYTTVLTYRWEYTCRFRRERAGSTEAELEARDLVAVGKAIWGARKAGPLGIAKALKGLAEAQAAHTSELVTPQWTRWRPRCTSQRSVDTQRSGVFRSGPEKCDEDLLKMGAQPGKISGGRLTVCQECQWQDKQGYVQHGPTPGLPGPQGGSPPQGGSSPQGGSQGAGQ